MESVKFYMLYAQGKMNHVNWHKFFSQVAGFQRLYKGSGYSLCCPIDDALFI